MYGNRGADGYISPDALERRLRFIPDRWEKGFSKQVQAWGSRAHFMQVRVLFFMRHWFNRWTVTIRKVQYVQPPRGGYVIAPEANSDWADEQIAKYPMNYRWIFDSNGVKRRRIYRTYKTLNERSNACVN
eukprot:COSAG05_NODE_424_length_9929_cov_25.816378_3_plen_130_part_00